MRATRSDRVRPRVVLGTGLALTAVVLVIGSVGFARYDWTGLPLQRTASSADRAVAPGCHEEIRPFVASSGRVIAPTSIDEQEYLSMVDRYRGASAAELQVECLYRPFVGRVATPWLASRLPFEDAASLAAVNTMLMVAGLWLVLAAVAREGVGARILLVVGALVAVSWNVLQFGTGLLAESGPFAAVAACWLAIVSGRRWWAVPALFAGLLFKETAIIVLPVLLADALTAEPDGRGLRTRLGPVLGAVGAVVAALVVRAALAPPAAATWPSAPELDRVVAALDDPVGLAALAVGVGPLLVPSVAEWWWVRRSRGWLVATVDPAVVGVLSGVALLGWSALAADLSPRFFWPCFPFAATLTARWLSVRSVGRTGAPSPTSGAVDGELSLS